MKKGNGMKGAWGSGLAVAVVLGLGAPEALGQRAPTTPRTLGSGTVGGVTTGGARGATGAREYPNSTAVGEAMISVDPETRQLIIVTDDETNLQVKEVINSLDRPKPQVLIKVVFLQVRHNDDLDLGVEASYTHKVSGSKTGTAGTDFGIAAAQALFGGGFYQILSDDLELLVRALAVAGKTEILSRPSILARNNQQATIIVGQEVPIITNTRTVEQTGDFINTVTYQDVGIILRVTPFITADGLVEMIVTPEISSLSNTTVDLGGGAAAPVIDKRSADTVVVTPSGKTVVIGGMIEKSKTEQVRKVPILGDIPLFGLAFRRTIKMDVKTELLIFLTPYVVQNPGDVARLTGPESGQLELAPKVFPESDLNRFFDTLPTRSPVLPPAPDPGAGKKPAP